MLAAVGFLLLYAGHGRREERLLAAAFPAGHGAYRAAVPAWRWRLRGAAVPSAGETGRPGWRRALAVEAWTLNAEFWLLLALWGRAALLPR